MAAQGKIMHAPATLLRVNSIGKIVTLYYVITPGQRSRDQPAADP